MAKMLHFDETLKYKDYKIVTTLGETLVRRCNVVEVGSRSFNALLLLKDSKGKPKWKPRWIDWDCYVWETEDNVKL